MLYVYVNNQGDIGYLDTYPFKLEDPDATILEIDQEYPQGIAGKSIQYAWNPETQMVDFTYIDMPEETIAEEEYSPTQEEVQEQILLNTEYNSILLENLLG